MEMAETIKGRVILKSVPNREIEERIAEYLTGIYGRRSYSRIASLVAGKKPLTLVQGITDRNGRKLVFDLNKMGARAFFRTNLNTLYSNQEPV